jgi:hypothetical protein
MSYGGTITGRGGQYVITDDPMCEIAPNSDLGHENAQVVDSIALPEILRGHDGRLPAPSTRDHSRNEVSRLSLACVGSLFCAISKSAPTLR